MILVKGSSIILFIYIIYFFRFFAFKELDMSGLSRLRESIIKKPIKNTTQTLNRPEKRKFLQ
ncbi:hypothetical protein JCM19298_1458 [Nonlabens ulvanivorans]|nr:hypothetical protein JCM19297_2528 [Nonlabens ulvanivorans]GAK94330.1 hypothetical protein JCM19298_1458 [Nonlabens ulvanivorans]